MRQLTDEAIVRVARAHGLPPPVLKAMLQTESGPNLDQEQRFEKGHYAAISKPIAGHWLAKFHTDDDDENRARATSWGVGHVMGWRLRDMGYSGDLADLNENDEKAAEYAALCLKTDMRTARKMKLFLVETRDDYERGIAVFNSGTKGWPKAHIDRYRDHLARATMTMDARIT